MASKWSNAQLLNKLEIQKREYDKEVNRLCELVEESNDTISNLESELEKYRRGEVLLGTDEQKMKYCLGYRAKGDDTTLILEKMLFNGMHISLNEIEDICRNIDSLDVEMQAYYKKCVDEYEDQVRLNPTILKQKNLEHNLFAIDQAKRMISECSDNGERKKYLELLNTLTLTNVKILSDTVLGDSGSGEVNDIFNNMADDYEKQKDNVIQFDLKKIKKA